MTRAFAENVSREAQDVRPPHQCARPPQADARADAMHHLEGAFTDILRQVRQLHERAAERVSPGLSIGAYKLLVVLDRCGRTSLSELAEDLGADKGLLSRQLSELETVSLVERSADHDDRRMKRVSITPLAHERLASARAPYAHLLQTGVDDWTTEQVEQVAGLLRGLASAFEAPPTR